MYYKNMLQKFLNLPFGLLTTILLIFFTFSIFIRTDSAFDQDLGRHLKLGEIILKTGDVPKTNLFSYTHPDFPFVNHHWLFEVGAYLAESGLGVEGLLILKLVIILLTVYLTLRISNRSSLLTLPVGFIFFHLLRERTDLRPEIFSFLFTALIYYLLEKFDSGKRKALVALPLIQILWINIHIYFLIGFILQGIYLIHLLFSKRFPQAKLLTGCILVSLLISLLNPHFIQGLTYPLTIFGNYGYSIVENQTVFLLESINFQNPNFLYYKIAAGAIFLSLLASGIKRQLSFKTIFLVIAGLSLATLNIRSFPYLVLISFPALTKLLPNYKSHILLILIYILSASMLIYESFTYLNGSYYLSSNSPYQARLEAPEHSKGAMDFVLANKLPQPIFNNFDIGSYIGYRGFPEYRVFVDGRPEAYPKEFFQNEYIPAQSDPKVFEALSERYNFQTIIFSHTDQTPWAQTFLTNIVKNPSWKVVYLDDFMIIIVRADDRLDLKPVALESIKPTDYHFDSYLPYLRLAIFFNRVGLNSPATSFYQQATRLNPNLTR
jgi:hypothetical protein